jgi:hypothetical protein
MEEHYADDRKKNRKVGSCHAILERTIKFIGIKF